jgi:hypothetical protein
MFLVNILKANHLGALMEQATHSNDRRFNVSWFANEHLQREGARGTVAG